MNARAKKTILQLVRSVAPQSIDRFVAFRIRRHNDQFQRAQGLDRLLDRYIAANGTIVASGPFAGLTHIGQAAGSLTIPKLIGSYEKELHAAITDAINRRPTVVVDIGAAEGYYAVGLALALPAATVYAFDIDPIARQLCRRMADANGVSDRVAVRERCDPLALNQLLVPGALVVCDCEGYERELIDPAAVPALAGSTMIVELHERSSGQSLPELLTARFSATHAIHLINTVARNAADYPALGSLSPQDHDKAMNEYRHGPQQWFVAVPRVPETV